MGVRYIDDIWLHKYLCKSDKTLGTQSSSSVLLVLIEFALLRIFMPSIRLKCLLSNSVMKLFLDKMSPEEHWNEIKVSSLLEQDRNSSHTLKSVNFKIGMLKRCPKFRLALQSNFYINKIMYLKNCYVNNHASWLLILNQDHWFYLFIFYLEDHWRNHMLSRDAISRERDDTAANVVPHFCADLFCCVWRK